MLFQPRIECAAPNQNLRANPYRRQRVQGPMEPFADGSFAHGSIRRESTEVEPFSSGRAVRIGSCLFHAAKKITARITSSPPLQPGVEALRLKICHSADSQSCAFVFCQRDRQALTSAGPALGSRALWSLPKLIRFLSHPLLKVFAASRCEAGKLQLLRVGAAVGHNVGDLSASIASTRRLRGWSSTRSHCRFAMHSQFLQTATCHCRVIVVQPVAKKRQQAPHGRAGIVLLKLPRPLF